jgi:translation elongation factor EF-4
VKNVTATDYGSDLSCKRELHKNQKNGKSRVRQIDNVELPQKTFRVVLKLND